MLVHKRQSEQLNKQSNKRQNISNKTIIQIQYCNNCDAHLFTVRHQQQKYSLHFQNIKKRLQQYNIMVKKKGIPQNLYKKSPYCPSNVYYRISNNQLVYFPSIGSFEVYLEGQKIFSKIESMKWPSADIILTEIQKRIKINQQKQFKNDQQKIKNIEQNIIKQQRINIINNKKQQNKQKQKQKKDQISNFRYSIDRRNLFKKPQNNYLMRRSVHTRNKSNSQATNRKNITALIIDKQINEQQHYPLTQDRNRKELTDQFVLQLYQKKPIKPQKVQQINNLPQVQKKSQRKNSGANVYLQPIFPRTTVNLENYNKQKMIMVNKIHEQRKSYEIAKHLSKDIIIKDKQSLLMKVKINEQYNILFKQKQQKNESLQKIKQITQQNQLKQNISNKQNQNIKQQNNNIEIKQIKQDIIINKLNISQSNLLIKQQQQNNKYKNNQQQLIIKQEKKQQQSIIKQEKKVNNIDQIQQKQIIKKQQINLDHIITTKTINQNINNQNDYQQQPFQPEQNLNHIQINQIKSENNIQIHQEKKQPSNNPQPVENKQIAQDYQDQIFENEGIKQVQPDELKPKQDPIVIPE